LIVHDGTRKREKCDRSAVTVVVESEVSRVEDGSWCHSVLGKGRVHRRLGRQIFWIYRECARWQYCLWIGVGEKGARVFPDQIALHEIQGDDGIASAFIQIAAHGHCDLFLR